MPIKMKVCNAADYNESLKKRGSIFHFFNEATRVWLYSTPNNPSKYIYSDQMIEILATLRYLIRFPYRQLEGMLSEYIKERNLNLPIPNYSTLCRRIRALSLTIQDHRIKRNSDRENLMIAIDSTGISIYSTSGSHGKENGPYRQYRNLFQVRKLHVALNLKSKKVIAAKITSGTTMDADAVEDILANIEEQIDKVYADGAYDRRKVREACWKGSIKQVIPPHRNAILYHKSRKTSPPEIWKERDRAIIFMSKFINEEVGREEWKKKEKYGKRSLVEAFFGRLKTIFGFHFQSRDEKARENELLIKIKILNSFRDMGGAIFKKVA
jgi:transposase